MRSTTFRRILTTSLLALMLTTSVACNTAIFQRRTLLVRSGQSMILREKLRNVKVFVVVDGKWEESFVEEIPPGAYITWRDPETGEKREGTLE